MYQLKAEGLSQGLNDSDEHVEVGYKGCRRTNAEGGLPPKTVCRVHKGIADATLQLNMCCLSS
jgi:hypothetical protein